MSRLTKSIRNAKVGLLFHALFIASQFISRKIFLDGLGDEFMGITATLGSFLTFINLAELGIGVAIGYTLYKPIFDQNHNEINKIILFLGDIYKKIGFIILGGSILLSAFFPIIFSDVAIPLGVVYFAFFGLLSSSLLGYFFNYHIFLLQADQKDYVVSKYQQSFTISKILLQGLFVFYLQNYYIWIGLEILSGLLYTIAIRKKIKQEYPWLILKGKLTKEDREFESYNSLVKKIKQISIHKFGDFLSGSTDNILIFIYLSAELVAYFANYQMVLVNLGTLVQKLFAGSNSSVGNLVAENNSVSIKQVFWEFMVLRFFVAGFGAVCIYHLINPFIRLWLGEKYLFEGSVILLFCAIFFLRQIVQPTEVFKQAYGLYDDIWAPIVKSILNLVISILGMKLLGLTGLLMGTFISVMAIEGLWRPYYVYKEGFKTHYVAYVKGYAQLLGTFMVAGIVLHVIFNQYTVPVTNYASWVLNSLYISAVVAAVYGLLLYSTSQYCRALVQRLSGKLLP